MRLYTIKHKGKTHLANMVYDASYEFPDGEKIYVGTFFFRKKDAEKYRKTLKYADFFEVVGMSVDKSKEDNRYTKNKTQ